MRVWDHADSQMGSCDIIMVDLKISNTFTNVRVTDAHYINEKKEEWL